MHNQICGSLSNQAGQGNIGGSAVRARAKTLATSLEGAAIRFFDAVLTWHESARSRHDLARLDDRMLSDIGVSRATVEREAGVSFWR
jgi:uncharacterized protein YjiS (DUF1127 family)